MGQPLCHRYKHRCRDITNIWMQDWLTRHLFHLCPHLPSFSTPPTLASPPCLSVCRSVYLSAPALRDEREEPLENACDHHHHCDWCHSDCCLGDGSSFAEQAPPPKVQGMAEEILKCCSLFPVWESTALSKVHKPNMVPCYYSLNLYYWF